MSDGRPMEFVSRRLVATNTCFTLHFDHLSEQGGEEVLEFLVVDPHYRSADGYTGVAIVPILDGGVLLQNVYRHPTSRWGWEVPRGFIDEGETPLAAAQRELGEETGWFCDVDALCPIGDVAPEPGVINGRILVVAALRCAHLPELRRPELGCGENRVFFRNEIFAMAGSATMSCSVSMAALFLYLTKCVY